MAREIGIGKYRFDAQIWAIWIAAVIGSFGFGIVFPFLAIYLSQTIRLSEMLIGIVMMSYMAIGTFFMIFGGAWADKFGRKRIMVVSLVGEGALLCMYTFASEFWGFLAIALAEGAVGSLYPPAANAMVADLVPPDKRPECYSLIRIAYNLGSAIGPMIGSFLLLSMSLQHMFLIAGVAVGTMAILIALKTRETLSVKKGEEFQYRDMRLAASDRAFMFFCLLIAMTFLLYAQTLSALPVYSNQELGIQMSLYGLVFATNAGMVVLLQIPVTAHAIRFRRTTALSFGQGLMALGMIIVFFVGDFLGLIFAMVVFTLGELYHSAVYSTVVADLAPRKLRGTYMGVSGVAIGIGDSAGMFMGMTLLGALLAPALLWLIMAGIGTASMIGYLALRKLISKEVDLGTLRLEDAETAIAEPPTIIVK
ncbi:MAG: MFS transporter [Thermoplasmata archaeon]